MSKRCARCKPNQTCPDALERVNARLADKKLDEDSAPGCPWAINSAEYNYCFWNITKDLEGDPKSDREICQLLNINTEILEKTWESILVKFEARKNDPEVLEWVEYLKGKIAAEDVDKTIYIPSEYKSKVDAPAEEEEELDADARLAKEMEELEDEKDKRRKRLKKSGMPVHRSGLRTDLYGIYSKSKLEKIKSGSRRK